MMFRKGQVATEFFLYSSVFLIIVIATASILYFTQSSEISALEYTVAREVGEKFADSINLVVKGGSGFEYDLLFPKTILGKDYAISFSPSGNFLTLDWAGTSRNSNSSFGNSSSLYPIIPSKYFYSGCIQNNQMLSSLGENKLKIINKDGQVLITQEGC